MKVESSALKQAIRWLGLVTCWSCTPTAQQSDVHLATRNAHDDQTAYIMALTEAFDQASDHVMTCVHSTTPQGQVERQKARLSGHYNEEHDRWTVVSAEDGVTFPCLDHLPQLTEALPRPPPPNAEHDVVFPPAFRVTFPYVACSEPPLSFGPTGSGWQPRDPSGDVCP